MKKTIVIIIIAILSATLIEFVWFGIGRTPSKILRRTVKSEFGIKIKDINPTVIHFEEEWSPNGDGQCLIKFKYDNGDSLFFTQFKQLPTNESLPYWLIKDHFGELQQGYYMFKQGVDDPRDFEVLIIDPKEHIGVLYYEYL